MSTTPADVRVGHVVLSLLRGLSDKALRWTSVCMAFGVTCAVLYRPHPWRAGSAAVFVALVSPLWLRKERENS